MKKAKLVKINKKEQVEMQKDSYSLKNLISIIITLIVILGIFYFITTLVIDPVKNDVADNSVTEIDSTKITLNNLLNRKSDEYYVLATKESDNSQANYIQLYNNYISTYKAKENALPFYSVDLSDALNKSYLSDKLNISNEISELRLNDEVLFKIKDGKIKEYFVGKTKILDALSKLKES